MIGMTDPWYDDKNKVLELCFFLVDTDQITTREDLIYYLENSAKYDEIWHIYNREINGVDVLPTIKVNAIGLENVGLI